MVLEFKAKNGDLTYACEECGFGYWDLSWAKKCEAWCRKNKTCNIEITRHSGGPVKSKK